GAGVLHIDEGAQRRAQVQLAPQAGAGLEIAAGVLRTAAEAFVVAMLGAEAQFAAEAGPYGAVLAADRDIFEPRPGRGALRRVGQVGVILVVVDQLER